MASCPDPVRAVAVSPDGRSLALAAGGQIHAYTNEGGLVQQVATVASEGRVEHLEFAGAGTQLIWASQGTASLEGRRSAGSVRVCAVSAATSPAVALVTGHMSFAVSPDGRSVACDTGDGRVCVFALSDQGGWARASDIDAGGEVTAIAYPTEGGGPLVATVRDAPQAGLWLTVCSGGARAGLGRDIYLGTPVQKERVTWIGCGRAGGPVALNVGGMAFVYDAKGTAPTLHQLGTRPVGRMAISPGGAWLAASGGGDEPSGTGGWPWHVWDLRQPMGKVGRPVGPIWLDDTSPVDDIRFAGDDALLTIGGAFSRSSLVRRYLRAHDWGQQGAAELSGHAGPVSSLAVSGDGRWVLTGSEDHTGRLWDTDRLPDTAKRPRIALPSGVDPEPGPLRFTADGHWMAFRASSRGRSVAGIDVGELIWVCDLEGGTGVPRPIPATCMSEEFGLLAYRPDNPSSAVASHPAVKSLSGHPSDRQVLETTWGEPLCFTPRRPYLVILDGEFTEIWDCGRLPYSPLVPQLRGIACLPTAESPHTPDCAPAVSPDGRWVLTWDRQGHCIYTWDLRLRSSRSPEPVCSLSEGEAGYDVRDAAFSPDGRWFALLHAKTLSVVVQQLVPDTDKRYEVEVGIATGGGARLEFSPRSDAVLITASGAGAAQKCLLVRLSGAAGSPCVTSLEGCPLGSCAWFSPDGKWVLATSGGDAVARLYQADSGRAGPPCTGRPALTSQPGAWCATFSPDGRWLATHRVGEPACVWDLNRPSSLCHTLDMPGQVMSVSFSDSSDHLACWSHEPPDTDTVRVWSTATTTLGGAPCLRLMDAFYPCFRPGTDELVVRTRQHALEFWPLEPSTLVRALEQRLSRGMSRAERERYLHSTPSG